MGNGCRDVKGQRSIIDPNKIRSTLRHYLSASRYPMISRHDTCLAQLIYWGLDICLTSPSEIIEDHE